jgi:hypothetical protein
MKPAVGISPARKARVLMQSHSLLFLVLLGLLCDSVGAQRVRNAPRLDLRLVGDSLAVDSEVAVIERRRGKRSLFEIRKLERGHLELLVPRTDGSGDCVSFFLIQGMKRLDQFDGFLDEPGAWSWAQIQTPLGYGQNSTLRLVPKGTEMQYRGRVLAPEGGPMDCLSMRFWSRSGVTSLWQLGRWMHQGYDPVSGRFWVMRDLGPKFLAKDCRIDFLPWVWPRGSRKGMAPLLRKPWPKGREPEISMPRAGRILVSPPATRVANLRAFEVSLIGDAGNLTRRTHYGLGRMRFDGLPEGTYRLEVRLRMSSKLVFTHRGIELMAGREVDLGPLKIDESMKVIEVLVMDAEEQPLRARIGLAVRVGPQTARANLTNSRIMATNGVCQLLVPKEGASLVVMAEGLGTRLFTGVKKNLDVTLHAPPHLQVQIRGLDEHPKLKENLYLRAEPAAGYPDWAWSILAPEWYRNIPKSESPRKAIPQFCLLPLEQAGREPLLIPSPGTWKFHLAYVKGLHVVRIPLPDLDGVEVDKQEQTLRVAAPPAILRRARARFDLLREKK